MKSGRLKSKFALTVPTVYIDPVILIKEGKPDLDCAKVIADLWKNYNVNIRYLYVYRGDQSDEGRKLALEQAQERFVEASLHRFVCEVVHEFDLLTHLQPSIIACFFGEKEIIPHNHKVYGRDELLNQYHIILSNQRVGASLNASTKYHRRRGDII